MTTPAESTAPAAAPKPDRDRLRALGLALVFGFFLFDGLLRTFYFYLGDLAEGNDIPFTGPLVSEMTGSLATLAVFFLIVVPLSRRFPLRGAGWKRRIPAHLAGLIVYSGIKTLLMWWMRIPLWQLLGFGPYDYGVLLLRFPMEGANDVFGYALLTGAVHFWDAWQAKRDRELREARLEAKLNEARLQALQGQLQPHFLFNTLNTISSVMYADPVQADRLLSRLSDLLRSSLGAPERTEVSLEEELEILDRYVELMSARFGDRLTVDVTVSPDARESRVPVFLLQPLVENAIQHGVARRSGPGRVDVRIGREGDRVSLVVEDDGPGIEGDPMQAVGKGVGLRNTRDRLAHLYGDRAALVLRNRAGGGLHVAIEIPFRPASADEGVAVG